MQRLQNRRDGIFDADGVGGAIVYAGDFRNEQTTAAWHVERPVPYLAAHDAEALATIMAALSHPQRLALVQLLLRGPHDRQQLQEALDISSPGQLYHHLHSLLDAGVVTQRRRGVYALMPRATIPLLAIMAAAVDISQDYQKQLAEEDE
jgi:ArsR family transcriptional regulator, arsenate/arsenite/antimonite-responsive transcriptional repressor